MMSCALHLKGAEAGETRGSVWAVHAVCVCLCLNHAARFNIFLVYIEYTKVFYAQMHC